MKKRPAIAQISLHLNMLTILLFAAALGLSSCETGTGPGYTSSAPVSIPQPAASQDAEKPPEALSDNLKAMLTPVESQTLEGEPEKPSYSYLKPKDKLPPAKVALLVPLTGQHADLGKAMLNAAQFALFDVGHSQLTLVPRDTKGTAAGARQAAEQALYDGAQLILGPIFSAHVPGVKAAASRYNVNVISFSTDWSVAGGNGFVMGFLPFDQVTRLSDFVSRQGITRVGMFYPRDDYGKVVAGAWQRQSGATGLQLTKTDSFDPGSNNLSQELMRFTDYEKLIAQYTDQGQPVPAEALPYEAVFMPVSGANAISIGNLLSNYAMPPRNVRRLATGLFDDTKLARERSLDGTWFAAPSPELRNKFFERYHANFGKTPPRLTTLAYDATALAGILAKQGLKTTGQPDFSRQALMNPNGFAGIDGIFRFRPDGTAERGLAILTYKGRRIQILEDAPKTFERAYVPEPQAKAALPPR